MRRRTLPPREPHVCQEVFIAPLTNVTILVTYSPLLWIWYMNIDTPLYWIDHELMGVVSPHEYFIGQVSDIFPFRDLRFLLQWTTIRAFPLWISRVGGWGRIRPLLTLSQVSSPGWDAELMETSFRPVLSSPFNPQIKLCIIFLRTRVGLIWMKVLVMLRQTWYLSNV